MLGNIDCDAVGSYKYIKILDDGTSVKCTVKVFPLLVEEQLADFPEKGIRTLKWIGQAVSRALIGEAELFQVLESFSKTKSKASI